MRFVDYNGKKLSKLSLGTVQFGLDYGISNATGKPAQEEVNIIIDHVCNNGVNCFDTAQAYGNSEEVLGKALKDKPNTYIVSKLKSDRFESNIYESIENTLKNLQLNSLYGLMLHDSKLLYDWKKQDSYKVDTLISSNKIEHFGVSIYTNEDFDLAIANEKIQIIQIPFNLFDQRAITEKWFTKAYDTNKLIFIRSIFLQGLFFMNPSALKGNLIQSKTYLEELHQIVKQQNLSISQLAMAFVDSVATNSVLLFGCDTLSQAKENIKNYNILPVLEQNLLDEIADVFINIPEHIINPTLWRLQ